MAKVVTNRSRIARLMTTEYSGDAFVQVLSDFEDFSAVGKELIDATGPDKRTVAIANDNHMYYHDQMVKMSPEWRETVFGTANPHTLIADLIYSGLPKDGTANILSYAFPQLGCFKKMLLSGDVNRYLTNDFETNILEEWVSRDPTLSSADLHYGVVDYSEMEDGSLTAFFDAVIVPQHRLYGLNMRHVDNCLDMLKSGGWLVIRNAVVGLSSYQNSMQMHHHFDFEISRYLATKDGVVSHHLPWANGIVVAQKQ